MKLTKITRLLFATLLFSLALPLDLAYAQTDTAPEFTFGMRRVFGYGGGSEIQGVFDLRVAGPEDLVSVEYFIDGASIAAVTTAPFSYRITTDDYSLGEHTLYALGQTASGETLESNRVTIRFVSAEQGWAAAGKIILPMAILIILVLVLSAVISVAGGKKLSKLPLGSERKYGVNGGAICPKCKRPFPLQFLSMNMLTGKLERCPFCGKWSIVRSQPVETLREAERAELKMAQPGAEIREETPEEKLNKELDQSKYTDL